MSDATTTVGSPVAPLPVDINAPIVSGGQSLLGAAATAAASAAKSAVVPTTSFLANGGLIVVGVILGIAALVVSQRETIIKVGETAARVAV